MPQIGWFEILIIVSIAIIVVGPKDIPFVLKRIGSWIGSIKKYVQNVQNEVSSLDEEIINNNDNKKEDIKKTKEGTTNEK
jgi:twin arginine-targeting protein translocase TatB